MKRTPRALLACMTLWFAAPLFAADAQPQYSLDIARQSLTLALKAFSQQTGLSVGYLPADAAEERTQVGPLKGRYTIEAALHQLLAPSGLTFERVNARTIAVTAPAAQKSSSAPDAASLDTDEAKASATMASGRMQLARTGTPAQTESAASEREERNQTDEPSAKGVPEMLVKGNRSSNIDIQRTEDDVQPYVVFTAEDIERSMTGSLDQFLMSRLPMNTSRFTAGDIQQPTLPLTGNISSIDLRGLGPNQTLILVNGRRMPGVSTGSDLSQSDINGIPLSSVARIEVLPSTAGGIYGGGATGGVINIILKDDYRGLQINARYDGTFRNDAAQRVLETYGGFSLEGGRTTVMLSGSFRDANPLLLGERDFAVRARQQLLRNNPDVFGEFSLPLGATTNILNLFGTPLVLASTGQSLGSTFTSVPYGYAGPASDGGAALAANAGRYNIDFPGGSQGLRKGLTTEPEVTSVRLNARRSFTDRMEAFLDAGLSRNDSKADDYQFAQLAFGIPPATPANPFTDPIIAKFPGSDFNFDTPVVNTSQVLNFNGGIIVRLPREWTVQGEYGWARSERDYQLNQNADAFYDAMVNGDLNILSDVTAYPLDYTPYLPPVEFTSWQAEPFGSDTRNAALRLAGPAFGLPAGPAVLSALLERRRDSANAMVFVSYSVFDQSYGYRYSPARSKTTDSAYVELTTPLIAGVNALPLVRALDLQASYRLDQVATRAVADRTQTQFTLASPDAPRPSVAYRTNHITANQYTLGLRYQPLESLTLRVSNAVGVLPPSLDQLVPNILNNANFSFLIDRARKNDRVGVIPLSHSGGNPDLVPEQSDSWSAGAILTPARLPGLRLSVDYTLIKKTDEISSVTTQFFIDQEGDFPQRVRRAPLTAADQAAGYTVGRIAFLDLGRVNIAHTRVEAYDLQAGYLWNTAYGAFQAEAIATRQTHLQKQLLATSPVIEYVGLGDGPLKWRGNVSLTWQRGAWTLGWNTQYFDSYPVYFSNSSAFSIAESILNQGSEFIPSQIYHDLSFKYRIGEAPLWGGFLANSEILVGVSNVFDVAPPLVLWAGASAGEFAPFRAAFGDPRMRRYSISLRKGFGGG